MGSLGDCCCGCTHECGTYKFPKDGETRSITLTISGGHPKTLTGTLVFNTNPTEPDCIATACVTFTGDTVWQRQFRHRKGCTESLFYTDRQCCPTGVGSPFIYTAADFQLEIQMGFARSGVAAIKYESLCLKFIPAKKRATTGDSSGYTCVGDPVCGGIRVEACLYLKRQLIVDGVTESQYSVVGTQYNDRCGIVPEDPTTAINYSRNCGDSSLTEPADPPIDPILPYPAYPALADWSTVSTCSVGRTIYLDANYTLPSALVFPPRPYLWDNEFHPDQYCNISFVTCGTACSAPVFFYLCDDPLPADVICDTANCGATSYTGYTRFIGDFGCNMRAWDLCLGFVAFFFEALNESCLALVSGRTRSCTENVDIADGDPLFDPYSDTWTISIT